jgi:hypothetical protein
MDRQQDMIAGYSVFFGRYASYVIHNELYGNRQPVLSAIETFLKALPSDFEPRKPIYYTRPYTHNHTKGFLGLLFEADAPTDNRKNVIVSAVQLPLSLKTAKKALIANCHWATEIWPAEDHSLIPVTCEFARGTRPAKRLNYIVSQRDNSCLRIEETEQLTTGFKHFISAAYSQYGLAVLDFQLTVRHHPSGGNDLPEQKFGRTKEDLLAFVKQEIACPLQEIKEELNRDKLLGKFAPKDLIYLDSFFETMLDEAAEMVYANLRVYRHERDSHINPGLQSFRFGHNVVAPPSEADLAEQTQIARILAGQPGSLEVILMLADVEYAQLDENLSLQVLPSKDLPEVIDGLRRSGLISISNTTIRLTDRGLRTVEKLRGILRQQEESNDIFHGRSG